MFHLPNKYLTFFIEGLINIPKITLLIFIVFVFYFNSNTKACKSLRQTWYILRVLLIFDANYANEIVIELFHYKLLNLHHFILTLFNSFKYQEFSNTVYL